MSHSTAYSGFRDPINCQSTIVRSPDPKEEKEVPDYVLESAKRLLTKWNLDPRADDEFAPDIRIVVGYVLSQ